MTKHGEECHLGTEEEEETRFNMSGSISQKGFFQTTPETDSRECIHLKKL